MENLIFTGYVFAGSILAGLLGSLTGLGGGVVIVPLLTLVFGVDIRYAIGASLISVISTSSGAASAYVKEGYTNIRAGMFLEIATTFGAMLGAYLTTVFAPKLISVVFGIILIYSAYEVRKPVKENLDESKDPLSAKLKMDSDYPTGGGKKAYHAHHIPAGFGMMFIAGSISGLLGIGSGALKVIAMDRIMRLPFKVSTATSNFMIGVTAAASAGIYLAKGYVNAGLAMPVLLGVLLGSVSGARLLPKIHTNTLRVVFSLLIFALGLEMMYNALLRM